MRLIPPRWVVGSALTGALATASGVAYHYRPRSVEEHEAANRAAGHRVVFPYERLPHDSLLVQFSQGCAIAVGSSFSALWLRLFNTLEISETRGEEYRRLIRRISDTNRRPLLTVSNHVSIYDDPSLLSAMMPFSVLSRPRLMRWNVCAEDVCYAINAAASSFFGAGKSLPVNRFSGVDQHALGVYARKLTRGAWLHMYPEGRTWQESGAPPRFSDGTLRLPGSKRPGVPYARLGPLKWGVGKVVAESEETPIITPIFHSGMEEVMPQESSNNDCIRNFADVGKHIRVIVGDDVEVDDIVAAYRDWRRRNSPPGFDPFDDASLAAEPEAHRRARLAVYRRVTERIQRALVGLDVEMRVLDARAGKPVALPPPDLDAVPSPVPPAEDMEARGLVVTALDADADDDQEPGV